MEKFLKHLGNKLSETRKVHKLSIEFVSKETGIAKSRLRSIEKGNGNFTIGMFIKLAKIYKFDASKFFKSQTKEFSKIMRKKL